MRVVGLVVLLFAALRLRIIYLLPRILFANQIAMRKTMHLMSALCITDLVTIGRHALAVVTLSKALFFGAWDNLIVVANARSFMERGVYNDGAKAIGVPFLRYG